MRWFLHGTLTPAVAEALKRHEHKVEVLPGVTPDTSAAELYKAAQKAQLEIITNDAKLAESPFANELTFGRSIVYVQLEGGDVEQDDAVDRLFKRYKRLTPGRLYTVTASRVKVRQLPGRKLA